MRLNPSVLSDEPQVHTKGFRSSDRGFLNLGWASYKRLLDWTAGLRDKPREPDRSNRSSNASKMPAAVKRLLTELGIDAAMWRDLVWEWQKYFGKSACVGRPESMRAHAEQAGRRYYRGQASMAECFH